MEYKQVIAQRCNHIRIKLPKLRSFNSDLHCVIGTSYWSVQLYIMEKTQCLRQPNPSDEWTEDTNSGEPVESANNQNSNKNKIDYKL